MRSAERPERQARFVVAAELKGADGLPDVQVIVRFGCLTAQGEALLRAALERVRAHHLTTPPPAGDSAPLRLLCLLPLFALAPLALKAGSLLGAHLLGNPSV